MTSYFWSGFPSLSGRSDVMYGRRHIGGATHPLLHVTPIGSDSYAIVPPITVVLPLPRFTRSLSPYLSASLRLKPVVEINRSIVDRPLRVVISFGIKITSDPLISRVNRHRHRVRSIAGFASSAGLSRVVRARCRAKSKLVFRLDGDTQLCINPVRRRVRMHRKLARPSGPAGTFQLLEGITTSVHHLLYLFSAHDHYDRGKD